MNGQDGFETGTVIESKDDWSDELIRAIERNRIEMEIASLRAEDLAGVLDSALQTLQAIKSKYSKSKSGLKNKNGRRLKKYCRRSAPLAAEFCN